MIDEKEPAADADQSDAYEDYIARRRANEGVLGEGVLGKAPKWNVNLLCSDEADLSPEQWQRRRISFYASLPGLILFGLMTCGVGLLYISKKYDDLMKPPSRTCLTRAELSLWGRGRIGTQGTAKMGADPSEWGGAIHAMDGAPATPPSDTPEGRRRAQRWRAWYAERQHWEMA